MTLTKNLKSRLWQIPYKVEILENILLNKYEAIWKEYNSLKEASELLQIKYNTLQQRLKNPRFENYKYVNIKL